MSPIPNWNDYFMTLVYYVASRSKDPRTHVGAVIVGPRRKIIATGYNGFPRNVRDDVPERWAKGEKKFWVAHAEVNAIWNAGSNYLDGCRMYTQGVPCEECAKGIVQIGINEVIVDHNWDPDKTLFERHKRTLEMFDEAEVKIWAHNTQYVPLVKTLDDVIAPLITNNQ